jgi:hypothetical protein
MSQTRLTTCGVQGMRTHVAGAVSPCAPDVPTKVTYGAPPETRMACHVLGSPSPETW